MTFRCWPIAAVAGVMMVGCSGATATEGISEEGALLGQEQASHRVGSPDVAPPQLVVHGDYSDRRFLDMMAAHHAMAVDMARIALRRAEAAELRELAQTIVDAQLKEIEELRAIKQAECGRSSLPTKMHPDEMQNGGMLELSQLEEADPFDRAFMDAMIPHHSGANRLASVARLRTQAPSIQAISRSIIDAQSKEIGTIITWRREWYPGDR